MEEFMTRRILIVVLSLAVALAACNAGGGGGGASAPTIAVQLGASNLVEGDVSSATATANGTPTQAVVWTSSHPDRVSVSPSGRLGAHNNGIAVITATSASHSSASGSASVTVALNPQDDTTRGLAGIIAGEIGVAGVPQGTALPVVQSSSVEPQQSHGDHPDFVLGDILVAYRDGLTPQAKSVETLSGARLQVIRETALPATLLLRADGADAAATLAAIAELQADPNVRYAQPNYWLRTLATPNDPLYSFQWHYSAINLPQAWDVTTGDASVVVAVVDTGILYSQSNPSLRHPDFGARILPGYDFISNPTTANDGGGRDPDPFDVGDEEFFQSSYHGSHVAGTIGATTNNNLGVAGVDWRARILPIRVLGIDGGSMLDVMEGTLWAAGFAVTGVPANPTPAHVINLSLGGGSPCSPFEQQAFSQIRNNTPQNAIVVVAAGNENDDAWEYSPASCADVITVGATETRGFRAPYSNYGTRIDVMAPGGDVGVDRNNDTYADGILSLYRSDDTEEWDYIFYEGTSMAAPHVAGVLALMKGIDLNLSFGDALSTLKATATPLTQTACGNPSSFCGAGLIDAQAAVMAVSQGLVPTPTEGDIAITPSELNFGAFATSLTVTLQNTSSTALTWALTLDTAPNNPGPIPPGAVMANPSSATLAGNGTQNVIISLDRALLASFGQYAFDLVFTVGTANARLPVTFSKAPAVSLSPQGPMIIAAFLDDNELSDSGYYFSDDAFTSYSFSALAGPNYIIAWSDENDNFKVDEGDFVGFYPVNAMVSDYQVVDGVDVVLERMIGQLLQFETLGAPSDWRHSLQEAMRTVRGASLGTPSAR